MPSPTLLAFYLLLWLVVAAETVGLCALARQVFGLGSSLLAQVATGGPPLGEVAPEIDGEATSGESFHLGGPGERPQVILFLSTQCSACRVATVWLATLLRRTDVTARAVVFGNMATVKGFASEYEVGDPLIADRGGRIAARFRVTATPYVLVLDLKGRVIGKGAIGNYTDVCDVLRVAEMRAAMGGVPLRGEVAA